MGRSQETFNKKEREKKRLKKKKEKQERREQRKLEKAERKKTPIEEQFMYVDEFGNLTHEKPDPTKRMKVKAEDIQLGVPRNSKTSFDNVRRGKVKFFSEEKGYGFVTDKETKESIFVHVIDAYEGIKQNHIVEFELGKGPKGAKAIKVTQIK